MFRKRWSNKPWYTLTAAGCIIVLVLVILLNLGNIFRGARTFVGYFTPVIIAIVMAFVINQLCVLYNRTIFSAIRKNSLRNAVCITAAVITVIAFLVFAMSILIPQVIDSISTLIGNLGTYEATLQGYIEKLDIFDDFRNSDFYKRIMTSGSLPQLIGGYITDNISNTLSTVVTTGKSIIMWVTSFIVSVYILAEKPKLKSGFIRLLRALFTGSHFETAMTFCRRCNSILTSYIVYNLLDALIVGLVNAAFFGILHLPYAGLISFVVGITNLVPTFGPLVGGAIGAVLLLLVKPFYALIFLIFTIALQTVDGYILKPKLFGSTMGVSGLWILIAIIACGRAFGVVGILAAIPGAAILDFLYKDYLMPWLERRHARKEAELAKSGGSAGYGGPDRGAKE